MAEKLPIFTVDWEAWHDGIFKWNAYHPKPERIEEPTYFLLDILAKYEVKAIFFVLGRLKAHRQELFHEIEAAGHVIGDHGYLHEHNLYGAGLFRSPYWDTTPCPGMSGGFFFRFLPYALFKRELLKTGVFWIHPHDVDESHPLLKNPFLNWKRHVGLKTARAKLDRLLSEVRFGNPNGA